MADAAQPAAETADLPGAVDHDGWKSRSFALVVALCATVGAALFFGKCTAAEAIGFFEVIGLTYGGINLGQRGVAAITAIKGGGS